MPEKQFAEFERRGAIPGHFNKVTPGGLDRVREREPKNPPVAIIQAEQQATEDYTAEKAYRIEGENGQQFVTINEQVVQQDPIAGLIDAVSKLGIPGDLVFDTIIDLSDSGNRKLIYEDVFISPMANALQSLPRLHSYAFSLASASSAA